jgi:hypothetical protein
VSFLLAGSRRIGVPVAVASLVAALLPAPPAAAADSVDEIHYSYGALPGTVVVNWRGAEKRIEFGLSTAYGFAAVARSSRIRPVDLPGPFREVVLARLAPDTRYHYRIGRGVDHVLRTAPLGSFRWVDVGDTASSLCKPWMTKVHTLIASLRPRFVTHGGDISEANVCGTGAVHRYYDDQQVWSTSAAFQPVWGNHEYGRPDSNAPRGTPRDSLANYKGRGYLTNPQTVPVDSTTRVKPPGCPEPSSSPPRQSVQPRIGIHRPVERAVALNQCRGEDWGWFQAGGVLFISYPEMWAGAMASWRPEADKLMAAAERDPSIDFVITYGHRPAYSSLKVNGRESSVRKALTALAREYSPRARHRHGKYVLNLAHHVHGLEVFKPVRGLTHVTNAGGGQGTAELRKVAHGSVLRVAHLGVLAGDYHASTKRLTLRWVCGPPLPESHDGDNCDYGDVVWSMTFTAR